MMGDGQPGFWRRDLEDFGFLRKQQSDKILQHFRGTYTEIRVDPDVVIEIPNQGSQGSCQGHALSTILEWIHALVTGKWNLQLSRAQAYYASQWISGIRGDSGSTITGGVKLATETGLCREELWPYPPRYNPAKPENYDLVLADSKLHRIGTSVNMTTYEAIRTFLGAGLGGVSCGISWNNSVNRALVEQYTDGGGGHALAMICLSTRLDPQGNPYIRVANSWGTNWGTKGWTEWSPSAIRSMLKSRYTVMIGMSDMPEMAPRDYTAADWERVLSI